MARTWIRSIGGRGAAPGAMFAAGILVCLGFAPAATAACSAPVANGNTRTVTCPGGTVETVQVPDHVGGITVEAIAGDGGAAFLPTYVGSGGGGRGTLTVAGPLALDVVAGTAGVSQALGGAGGSPGGGAGAGAGTGGTGGGGGGGGLSSITYGATTLIVAGGGGGAGSSSQHGKGGSGGGGASSFAPDGQPGGLCNSPQSCDFPGALGGTQSAGGAGQAPGTTGSAGAGGDGGTATGAGGGGAGCFGGGGGGTTLNGTGDGGGGGGGASTCIDPSITDISFPLGTGGDGRVVIEYSVPVPPSITSTGPASFTVGVASSYTITSTGAPAATISLDSPAALPAGLTFTAGATGSGTATISGAPTGPAGPTSVTVRASNGHNPDATQGLTIDVAAATPTPSATATPTATPTPSTGIASSGGGFVTLAPGAEPVTPIPSGVAVDLSCAGPGGKTCQGRVAVSARVRKRGRIIKPRVGFVRYTIAAGRFKTVRVTLNRRGRTLLRRLRRLKVDVKVTVTTDDGQKRLTTKRVTIRAKKRADRG